MANYSGNDKARRLYQTMIDQGYSPQQASAIVGNAIQESSLNTNAVNKGDGRDGSDSIGAFQWNGPRARAFHSFAEKNGLDKSDIATHGKFVDYELRTSEKQWGDKLRNAKTFEEANDAMVSFERPRGWSAKNPRGAHAYDARLNNGINVYNSFSGDNYQPNTAVAQATYIDPAVSVQPAAAPTPPKEKGLFGDVGQKVADAVGITGDGSKENPTKLWGMEVDGENGILSDLESLSKAFSGESSAPVPQMLVPQRGGATQQKPIELASSVYKGFLDDSKRKRNGLFYG
ncbi:hypothetical protein G6M86_20945 [Agrobacterium tumefaciens]|uniref:Phage tail lysozyme domain-containing protein n=1 Tax=Agrobacterium tumefaciens TaxID=358 RepID=A0AAJ4N5S0_AGRTU|nr:hypothetical protein G6M86_20945 [Agrobacterium tumefaciens]